MPSTTRLVRGVDEAVTGRSAAPSAVRQSVAASSDQAGRELEEQLLLEMKYAQEIKNKQAEKATEAAPEPEQPKLSPLEDGVYRDDTGATFLVEGGQIKPTSQGTTLRDRVDSLMSTFPKEPVFPKPLPPSTKKESTLRERVDKLASDISWEEARNSAPIEEIALTKAEFIFFEDMKSFDRESWRQLKEAVPSIEVEDNKLRLNLADIQAFDEYIKEEELLQYMRRGEGPNPFYSPPLNQAPSIPPRLIDERFQDDLLFGTRREDPNLTDELTRSGRRRRRSPEDKARIKRGDFYSFVGPAGAAGLTGTEYVDKVSSDVVLDVNGVPKFELDDSGATFLVEGGKIKPTDMSQAEGKPDTSQASSVEPVYDRDESGNIFFLEGDKKISSKDKIFYHSTTADFENFEIKDSTAFDYGDGESSGGIFFSPDPSGGSMF